MNLEKEKEKKIEQWAIINTSDPFKAPEQSVNCLTGIVDGNEHTSDELIELDVTKNMAITDSCKYFLDEPSSEFKDFLNENGYDLHEYKISSKKEKITEKIKRTLKRILKS